MQKQLYSSFILNPTTIINQYIVPCKIHEKYTDLICYGVCIEQVNEKYGGRSIRNSVQFDNVFCKYDDVINFMKYIYVNKTKPDELNESLNRFVDEIYLTVI